MGNAVINMKFKDEDGGEEEYTLSDVRITPLDNGYLLELYIDEEELREAFLSKSELLERLEELL